MHIHRLPPAALVLFCFPALAQHGLTKRDPVPSIPPVAYRLPAPPEARTFKFDVVEIHQGREVSGSPDFAVDCWGYRYLFSSKQNADAFLGDYQKYEVQLGGACAKMGPLSGRGATTIHTIHDGRLFTFASPSCKENFLKDPEARTDRPDPMPATTPESLARGQELLTLMLTSMGGAAKVDAMSSLRMEATTREKQGSKDYNHRRTWIASFPDKFRRDDDWDEYKYAMIVTPDFGVMAYSQVEDMHPQQRLALSRGLYHLPGVIARLRSRDDFIAVAAGAVTINETKAEKLTVWFDSTATTLAIDPASGKVLAAFFRDRGKGGAIGAIEMRSTDWRDVDGLTLPAAAEAWFNNERWEGGDLRPDTLAINDVSADLFTKPTPKE
ncbi:MAG: hypothetical protein JNL50_02635 [Phycisphaerae bacterium]|nr:hypothetical protein [Phycisphaerae bacterium]